MSLSQRGAPDGARGSGDAASSRARRRVSWQHARLLAPLLLCLLSAPLVTGGVVEPDGTGPLTTYVQVAFVEVAKIDAVQQTFYADFYFTLYWNDTRYNTSEPFDAETMFWPETEFVNRLQADALTLDWTFQPGWYGVPARLIPAHGMDTVEYGSWWSAYARVGATFVTKLFLQSFPMDIQNATLRIESPYFGDGRIRYVPLPGSEKYVASSKLDVVGWTVKGAGAETRDNYYDAFDETYSQLKVFVTVSRLTTYYMGRLVTNVSLLVFMAFLASTLRPDIPERIIGVVTVFLAIVTWMFVIMSDSPRVGYTTRLDKFMNLSFAIVFGMSVAHAINYVLFTMKKERLKREHRASLSTISSAVLQLMNTQEQMATASRQNTNMYDSGTEEDWGIGAGVRRRRLPHSMSSRARSPFSASYGDEASFTQDSPRATGRSAYTLTSAPAPRRQQLDAEETEIVYMESSMPPEPSSTTVTPRPGDVHPTPRRSSSFREGGSATRLPPIRTTVVSPTRQASSFRGRIDRVVPVQDVEGGVPAFNPLAEPSPVELSQLAPSPPVAQLPANPSATPLAVNVPEPAAKQADGAPAPGIPAAQRQALKAAALKARRNAPSDARSRRGGWAACRPLKMCMNAWYKADASRKIDVVITLACALAYILGVFVIFAPPSDVTIDE